MIIKTVMIIMITNNHNIAIIITITITVTATRTIKKREIILKTEIIAVKMIKIP